MRTTPGMNVRLDPNDDLVRFDTSVRRSNALESRTLPIPGEELPSDDIVAGLDPVTLDDLAPGTLMNRVDKKFVVPVGHLAGLLERLRAYYRVLEVGGSRVSGYSTVYLDTPRLDFYNAHQTGRATRYKVRVRSYLNSRNNFLEVKLSSRRGRTIKARAALSGSWRETIPEVDLEPFGGDAERISFDGLSEVLRVDYQRIALIGKGIDERVTLDLGLSYRSTSGVAGYAGALVMEVKQASHGRSPAIAALRELQVRPAPMSKYCIGVARLVPGVRINRFKPALERLRRVESRTELNPSG